MTNEELSAKVAKVRVEKRQKNPIRSLAFDGKPFSTDDEYLPWPKPYATDRHERGGGVGKRNAKRRAVRYNSFLA